MDVRRPPNFFPSVQPSSDLDLDVTDDLKFPSSQVFVSAAPVEGKKKKRESTQKKVHDLNTRLSS